MIVPAPLLLMVLVMGSEMGEEFDELISPGLR